MQIFQFLVNQIQQQKRQKMVVSNSIHIQLISTLVLLV